MPTTPRGGAALRAGQDAVDIGGVRASNPDGIIVWIEVSDEQAALVSLASYGIAAGAGSKCFITPQDRSFLRIATSRLPDDRKLIGQLASTIARAVNVGASGSFD